MSKSRENIAQWQNDLREWYYLKSKEYASANYQNVLDRNKHRNEIETRLDKFAAKRNVEHNQLLHSFAKLDKLRINSPTKVDLNKNLEDEPYNFNSEKRNSLPDENKFEIKQTSPIKPEQFLNSTSRPLITVSRNVLPAPEFQSLSYSQSNSLFAPFQTQAKLPDLPNNTGIFSFKSNPFPSFSATPSTSSQENTKLEEKHVSFNLSTPKFDIPSQEVLKRKAPVASIAPLPCLNEESKLKKWLDFHLDFYAKLHKSIEIFERDTSQKELRSLLKRNISEKIDVLTKRNANNKDIANSVVFIGDLLNNQHVTGINKEQIQISPGNQAARSYATVTICDKYLTLIKWDIDLLDVISMINSTMFFKSKEFRVTFISKIVHFMVLLHFDLDKITQKINYIMEKCPESLANWLLTEAAVFRLFCRLQIILSSSKVPINNDSHSNMGGIPLIVMIFEEAIKLETPVLLCSGFIMNEILNNCSSYLIKNVKYKEMLRIHFKNLEKIINTDFNQQIFAVAKKLTHGGENFLKTSTAMLKSQFEETLNKIRDQIQ